MRRRGVGSGCGCGRAGRVDGAGRAGAAAAWPLLGPRSARSLGVGGSVVSNGTMVAATCGIRPTRLGDPVGGAVVQQPLGQPPEGPARQQHGHLGPVARSRCRARARRRPGPGGGRGTRRSPAAPGRPGRARSTAAAAAPASCAVERRRARRAGRSGAGCRRSAARAARRGRAGRRAPARCAGRSAAPSAWSWPHPGHQVERARLGAVPPVQPHQQQPAEREQQHHQPGALGELDHREDQHDQGRHDAAGEVDRQLAPPARLAVRAVVAAPCRGRPS